MKWEYLVERTHQPTEIEVSLARLGPAGWELVSCVLRPGGCGYLLIYKRPKEG